MDRRRESAVAEIANQQVIAKLTEVARRLANPHGEFRPPCETSRFTRLPLVSKMSTNPLPARANHPLHRRPVWHM